MGLESALRELYTNKEISIDEDLPAFFLNIQNHILELLKLINGEPSNLYIKKFKLKKSPKRIEKIPLNIFLYYMNEHLIFSKHSDEYIRDLKVLYRQKLKEDFKVYELEPEVFLDHQKVTTRYNLALLIMRYGVIPCIEDNELPKEWRQYQSISTQSCYNLLSDLFLNSFNLPFIAYQTFKEGLKKYKDKNPPDLFF